MQKNLAQVGHVYSLEAKQIIREIVSDMISGVVPEDVPNFSALHDHVDANEYFLQATGIFAEAMGQAQMDIATEVADEVTWWLQHTGATLNERIAAQPII